MKVHHSAALASHTSLHVGGPAEALIELGASDDLQAAIAQSKQPVWVLGDATNCLISDKGLPGTVIINHTGAIAKISPTRLKAGSGVAWDDLVKRAIKHNLYGLEFTSGVPGSVGAAVAGNIAAYGHSVSSCLVEATILDTADNSVAIWQNNDFQFAYRSSALQKPENKNLILIDATFELSSSATDALEYGSAQKVGQELGIEADSLANRRKIIMETRRRAGSLLSNTSDGPWTAGSFFKNPLVNEDQVNAILAHEEAGISRDQLLRQNKIHSGNSVRVSAAHVLLAAGFNRNQSWGQVRLHPDHILKVENIGDATAQEIYDVIQMIIKTVKRKLGITLEPEVRFLGVF